jgi:type VI secretion system protein
MADEEGLSGVEFLGWVRRKLPLQRAGFFCLGLAAILGGVGGACSANPRSFFGGDLKLQVAVARDANENSPVAVELLVISNEQVLNEALKLTAQKWFEGRDEFRHDHPEGYVSWSWEWVPGQQVEQQKLSFGVGARAGLLFADYGSAGNHRQRFDPHQSILLRLDERDFTVEPRGR